MIMEISTATVPLNALKILFITLEFRAGTFSGNGVYATAQVRALATAGHKLLVVSAQPPHAKRPEDDFGAQSIFEVPVSSWHRLDAGAPWREFAAGVLDGALTAAIRAFAPDVVLAVDWSALPAVRNLAPYCAGAPYVYLNYRVFTRTAVGEDLDLVRGLEAAAMSEAALSVALSRSDAQFLATEVPAAEGEAAAEGAAGAGGPAGGAAGAAGGGPGATTVPKVLLPALRDDVRQLPPPPELLRLAEAGGAVGGSAAAWGDGAHATVGVAEAAAAATAAMAARPYFSCVVRLSPEKEPERFVAVVEAMAAGGVLQRHGLTPLLLGAASDEYAEGLKARLRAAAPSSVILERFMGPADLAEVYRNTRLNFHPPTYDAYGMTIVEAASQGAPSLVHDGDGAVGATELLRGAGGGVGGGGGGSGLISGGEVFLTDLTAPPDRVAAVVDRLMAEPGVLAATAARALTRARSWDEAANAAELVRMIRQVMAVRQQCGVAEGERGR